MLGLGFIEAIPALGIGRKDFWPGRGDENPSVVPQMLDSIFQMQRNRQRKVFQKADGINDSAVKKTTAGPLLQPAPFDGSIAKPITPRTGADQSRARHFP